MVTLGVVFSFPQAMESYRSFVALRDYGMTAVGQITDRFYTGSNDEGGSGAIRYMVDIDNQRFVETVGSNELYRIYSIGDNIDVLYLPWNPKIHRTVLENQFLFVAIIVSIFTKIVLVGLVFFVLWVFSYYILSPTYRVFKRR